MNDNRTRVLGEVLSLDAWHDPFQCDGNSSGVFVELSFHEGRLGGETSIPFTFKVELRRALLTVRLEAPLEIDRHTVARSIPEADVELRRIKSAKAHAEASLSAKAKLSPRDMALALTGSFGKGRSLADEEVLSVVQALPENIVTPRPLGASAYSWEIEPTYRDVLKGQPWDPVGEPRLKIKSLASIPRIAPAITVEISCDLADVHISDLKLKDNSVGGRVAAAVFNDVNEAAAIQHLKHILSEADLEPSTLDNRFARIVL